MLKKRISACLVIKDSIVVQSIEFNQYLPIGKPTVAAEFLCKWGVDEIILIDISATKDKRTVKTDLIKEVAERTRVPLSIGGGVKTIDEVDKVMGNGADKIVLNNELLNNPQLITKVANKYGTQCVVASIDVIKKNGSYFVYNYFNRTITNLKPEVVANDYQKLGAGEIFLNSVDNDGTYKGYDINLIDVVCSQISIPLIACGGAKNANDMVNLFIHTNASAACASNFFHFTEQSITITKAWLKQKNIDVRLDTFSNFQENSFDNDIRLSKKDDSVLEKMRFIKIEKEII